MEDSSTTGTEGDLQFLFLHFFIYVLIQMIGSLFLICSG